MKLHAKRLLMLLNKKDPCYDTCPASKRLNFRDDWLSCSDSFSCYICREFISIKGNDCPCNELGGQEAVKRTWLALEEGGWLD